MLSLVYFIVHKGTALSRSTQWSTACLHPFDKPITSQRISELRTLIEKQYTRAKQILTEHKEELERLVDALMEHELLDADEINRVLNGERLETVRKTRPLPKKRHEDDSKKSQSSEQEAAKEDTTEKPMEEPSQKSEADDSDASPPVS